MTSSDTAAYILDSTFGQINPIKNVPFPCTGSVAKSQYWKRVTRTFAENGALGTYLASSALPVDGNCLKSVCSFKVSVLSPAKTFANIHVTAF